MIEALPGYDAGVRDEWRRRLAAIGAFLTPLILAAVIALLAAQVQTSNRLRAAEMASQEQRARIQAVLSAHQDIETGSRGYVITGQRAFLEPFIAGESSLRRIGPALRQYYANDPAGLAIVDRLSQLSRQKRDFAASSIALRRSAGKAAAEERVTEGRGKVLMDGIRAEIRRLLDHQSALLAEATRDSGRSIAMLRVLSFGLMAVLVLLLAGAWLALQRTIASRDRALVRLQDDSQRRKAILEGAMDGIVTINPSGSIESANPAIERMTGYSHDELDRRDVGVLLATPLPLGEAAERLREMNIPERGSGTAREIMVLRKDGTTFPAEVALSLVHLTEGLRYVAVIRDVTERKRVEQLKSEFVSTVSHELRTPLTSIAGSLGLLASTGADTLDRRSARLVEIAHGNANRLVRLINDILDIEKMEAGRMPFHNVELDLRALISSAIEAVSGYAQEYGVTLQLSYRVGVGTALVSADRDRLCQVFDNLLSNAIKFSPRDGTVMIDLEPGEHSHVVSIRDEGPGIPQEFHERVFSKFAQADASDSRQKGGTGLGLAIVREIVRRLDGDIGFTTQPGRGTTFRLRLPALNARPVRAVEAQTTLLVCGNGAAATFTEALRHEGYRVRLVKTVSEVADATQHAVFAGIVVDMGLADGAGVAMIRAVRQSLLNARTPVLALGGRPGESELDGDAALVLDWLHKPDDVARLVESIDVAAAGNRPGALPRVLHVEDDPDVVVLVSAALEGRADVVAASGLAAARAELARGTFDLAVVDITLSDGSGIALLPELRANGGRSIPVVVFSAQDADPETARAVDAYLTKARTPIGKLVSIVGSLARPRPLPEQQQP